MKEKERKKKKSQTPNKKKRRKSITSPSKKGEILDNPILEPSENLLIRTASLDQSNSKSLNDIGLSRTITESSVPSILSPSSRFARRVESNLSTLS